MQEGYIICSNEAKERILKNETGLRNYKFLTPSLLKDMLYGSFKPSSIIFLHNNYHMPIEKALEVIKYLPFVELDKQYKRAKLRDLRILKEALINNGYFIYNPNQILVFKRYNVTFINPPKDKLTLAMINKLKEVTNVDLLENADSYNHLEFKSYPNLEIEAYYAFKDLKNVLKENKEANIYFVNTNSSYYPIFKRMSLSFKVSINLKSDLSIISNLDIKNFLKGIKEEVPFTDLINIIKDNEIKNIIISIINKYELDINKLSDAYSLFNYLFRNKKHRSPIYDKAINLGSAYTEYGDNDYVYLFNFNSDFPKPLKDEGFLNRLDLLELGLDDYISQNKLNKAALLNNLRKIKNLRISFPYRLSSLDNILSDLRDDLNLKETKILAKDLGTSEIEDILSLGAMLDDYNLYGINNPLLGKYNLDKVNYLKYDNRFKPFSEEFILNHKPSLPIKMSYSNVKVYYSCPFHYYLDRILKLATFEGTMATRIGSYAHTILEKSYQPDFDFELAKAEGKKELSKKEQFFASLMDEVVADLLEFNKAHEEKMALDKTLCEHEFSTQVSEGKPVDSTDFDQDINFYGFIDKIKYEETDDKVYVAIYDYKTGGDIVSLDNVIDGENLQLPSYLFLLNKDELFKNKEVIVLGMYLQKVNVTLIDGLRDKKLQRELTFKLKGYSTNNRENLSLLDPYYQDSTYIQSLKTTNSGEFVGYAKLYNEKAITNLLKIVPDLLEKLKNAIYQFDFPIKPLRIDGKSNSCIFCPYNNICYKTEKDYLDKEKKPFSILMEEDYHGLD